MFASPEAIYEFTHKRRYSAQARVLEDRGLKFDRRADGTIALRQEELDRYTLTHPVAPKKRREWRPDLSVLDKVG